MNYFYKTILFFALALCFLPQTTFGAEVYFVPAQEMVPINKPFPVVVWIDTEGEAINAIEGIIKLDVGLSLVSIAETDSIIGAWVRRPQANTMGVVFSGVIPGGYISTVDPYRNVIEPGRIFTLVLQAKNPGTYNIDFSQIAVAKHDGEGTAALVEKHPLKVVVSTSAKPVEIDQFLNEVEDNIPPEPFEPIIYSQSDAFEGETVLVFQAKDNQSGIFYYEVRIGEGNWVKAESPYVLEHSVSHDRIQVKAFDRAGNFRLAEANDYQPHELVTIPWWVIIIIGASLALVLTFIGKRLLGARRHQISDI